MPTFVNQPLLWGLAVVAAPVIIHLINLLRHRRVRWAAMEFVLASQRKNSTWIRLKELLLLLLRMAAVAAVVLIVARPRLDGGLAKRLGDVTTHHIVLLDDSFSMSDRFAERNVFEQAKSAVAKIAQQAVDESSPQTFTLLRTSRATPGGAKPDLFAEPVNAELIFRDRQDRRLNRLLEPLEPSDSSAGPTVALQGLSALLKPSDSEERIVYVVSDFRARDWRGDDELRTALGGLEKKSSQLYFVNCADADRPNVAITALTAQSGTRTAGVHFDMQVEVKNYGRTTVDKAAVEIRADGDAGGLVFLDPIEPGQSGRGRIPVFFSNPGEHLISVSLEADAVEADNRRYAVVTLPKELPVLLVDGVPDSLLGRETGNAISPAGAARSGLEAHRQPTSILTDESVSLGSYRSIVLVNIDRLEAAAVRNLEAYARDGGGVFFILGDKTRPEEFNAGLYRNGAGLFPVPLDSAKQLFRDRQAAGDIVALESPIFDWFRKIGPEFLSEVTVDRYLATSAEFDDAAAQKAQVKVHARLRNGAAYVVEKPFGRGRIVALLGSAVPPWSDLYRRSAFVLINQFIQSQLAVRADELLDRRVGMPLVQVVDPKAYKTEAQLLPPGVTESAALKLTAVPKEEGLQFDFADTATAGVYRLDLQREDKTSELRHFAFNVDAVEGELTRIDEAGLRERLPGVKFYFRQADRISPAESDAASSTFSTWILYALVAMLLGEQALAYSASYHPRREAAR